METICELREICQSQKINKPKFLLAIGYTWHRRLSIYITYILLSIFPRITPNTISFSMIIVSIIGCTSLLPGIRNLSIAGMLIVYLGFLLDKCDGEVARYKKINTLRGVYLDELYLYLYQAV